MQKVWACDEKMGALHRMEGNVNRSAREEKERKVEEEERKVEEEMVGQCSCQVEVAWR